MCLFEQKLRISISLQIFFFLFLFLFYFVFIGFTFNACSLLHTKRSENKTRSTKNRIAWKCERDTLKLETKCHDAMHMFCIIFSNVSVSVTCNKCVCTWCERKRKKTKTNTHSSRAHISVNKQWDERTYITNNNNYECKEHTKKKTEKKNTK